MSCFDTEVIIDRLKIFWQYPVITEQTFYQQNETNINYLGIPWATIIDKKYNLNVIYNLLKGCIRQDVFIIRVVSTFHFVVYYHCLKHSI